MSPEEERCRMVAEQLELRGLRDKRLLAAFRSVPRHLFVPSAYQSEAYSDHPLPIGSGQTISQPYIIALMASELMLTGRERVLEIGAGSGYLTAILAQLAMEVFAVERITAFCSDIERRMRDMGYHNVHVSHGNGSLGWSEHAPYDCILMSASAPEVPKPLIDQLGDPGRMVLPIGTAHSQRLVRVERIAGIVSRSELTSCVFVPLIGKHGWSEKDLP